MLAGRRRQQLQQPLPGEVSDGTTQGLAAKVNELIAYLRKQREAPGPVEGDVNLSDLYNAVEAISDKVAQLEKLVPPVPEAPKDVGSENMCQEPAIKCGKVVACYDGRGEIWTAPIPAILDIGGWGNCAVYCKVNPCGFDPENTLAETVDTSTELLIGFPQMASWQTWTDVYMAYDLTGVVYCPVGTRVYYFPQRYPVQPGNQLSKIMDGMEAGYLRMLPWVLPAPTANLAFTIGWNPDVWGFTRLRLVVEDGFNFANSTYKLREFLLDPTGRVVHVSTLIDGQ